MSLKTEKEVGTFKLNKSYFGAKIVKGKKRKGLQAKQIFLIS